MRSTMRDHPLVLTHILDRMRTLFPAVEVVTRQPDRSIRRTTYGEICRRAGRLARALGAAGYGNGARVATLCWNHSTHFEAYFGIPAAGCVLHTLNLRLAPADIAFIANHAGDSVVIVDDVLLPLFESLRERIAPDRVLVVPFGGPVPDGYESYEDFLATAPDEADWTAPAIAETDAAGMCYTSGTTGAPKGIVYSHRSTMLHALGACLPDAFGLGQNDVILPVVPMFHVNAWGMPYAGGLVGAKMVFPGPHLDAPSLLDLMADEGVTFSGGVPTIWFTILQALDREPGRWKLRPGLRTVVGGSAAPRSMIERFDGHGITTVHAWGMTEMSPLGTIARVKAGLRDLDPDRQYDYRARQGLPLPLVELRAVDDNGREVPWDGRSMGELQTRGPWIAARYHDAPEAQDKWDADGWFRTGDIVTIDPEGYVQITDRSKDVIKSGGEWISSVDLENAIMAHPAVAEAAVIAVPHPKWDERPLACVVPVEGATIDTAEINAFLSGRFARWQLPDAIVIIDEVPKTSTGKFQKLALRERFRDWRWDDADRDAG